MHPAKKALRAKIIAGEMRVAGGQKIRSKFTHKDFALVSDDKGIAAQKYQLILQEQGRSQRSMKVDNIPGETATAAA